MGSNEDRNLEFDGEDEQIHSSDENPQSEIGDNSSSTGDTTGETIATSLCRKRSKTDTFRQETIDWVRQPLERPAAKKTRARVNSRVGCNSPFSPSSEDVLDVIVETLLILDTGRSEMIGVDDRFH